MQRFLALFGHWLHTLAFAAWFGGMLVVGALVAPAAFGVNRPYAAQLLELVFRRLNVLSFICGAIMLGATWAEWRIHAARERRLLFVRAALTSAALALAVYLGVRLLPILVHLRSAGQMADFDRLHQVYEAAAQVQFWLLAAVAGVTTAITLPWRTISIRGPGGGVSPTTPVTADGAAVTPGAPRR